MNRDNFSALLMAIAVVSVIVGFAIYFNSPGLNKASSAQQQVEKFVSGSNHTKRYYDYYKARQSSVPEY